MFLKSKFNYGKSNPDPHSSVYSMGRCWNETMIYLADNIDFKTNPQKQINSPLPPHPTRNVNVNMTQ